MAKIVNLNKTRKARAKADKRRQADANAVAFGRSKVEKAHARAQIEKAGRDLDGHKRDP